jgi:hypothetical protein
MSFTLCIVLIEHHACLGDEVHEEVVVEEPQEVKVIDEPPKFAQGSPLCIPMLLLKCIINYGYLLH